MTTPGKRVGVLVLFVALVASALTYAASRYQGYRIQKIEFIIWDREHENSAQLGDTDLIRFVQACGADTVKSGGRLRIWYHGIFQTREWAVTLHGE